MRTIQTTLVGFGFSGVTFHAPFLKASPRYAVRQVVSSKDDALKLFPEAKVVPTLDTALQDDATELVVITTPSALHFEMASASIRAGKHVLLEKPAVVTVEEGEELMRLAAQYNVHVAVYQNRRYDGDFLTVKQLIETQGIGEWKLLESRFDRFRPLVRDRWREQAGPGSGILFDLGSHLIDQALLLLGEPDAVTGDVLMQREGAETDDGFCVTFYYGEKRVILRSSPYVLGKTPRFELHGTKGSYVKYGMDPQEARLATGEIDGTEPPEYYGTLSLDGEEAKPLPTVDGSYQQFYADLAAGLDDGRIPVALTDALKTMRLIEAARLSSREGRRVERNEW